MSVTDLLRFETIDPANPDLDAIAEYVTNLCATLRAASSTAELLPAIEGWNHLIEDVDSYEALVHLRFAQDTRNAQYKAAREAWDQREPRFTELLVEVKQLLLKHPLRAELEAALGAQAFALWESDVLAFDSAIKEDLVRESQLNAQYAELCASAKLEFRGENYNLSTIIKHLQGADRATRHDADEVRWHWFEENGAELDSVFEELVALRTKMARQLGFSNFVELGYKRMKRVDYDREDVERFRAQVVADVVPLCEEVARRQTKTLGVEKLMSWDEPIHDLAGNPKPRGDRAWMIERAQEVFDGTDARLGEFFTRMNRGGFLDLDSRDGKEGGGFCTSFLSYGMPFVFANFNGSMGDVRVLTHEIGHAFQNYESRHQAPVDYRWPTAESAEVHSMGLEFLTHPLMESFFGEDAERFRRVHLTQALLFLPYGSAVDHFQHLLYERPEATPAERHELWLEMERLYLPWRDWGDLAYPAKGGRWQAQSHLYSGPFYYIDYVLAQTCALQFWTWADKDRPAALESYVKLCGRGGSAPFQELVRSAGLVSPFDAGCLTDVVSQARASLGLS